MAGFVKLKRFGLTKRKKRMEREVQAWCRTLYKVGQ